jgi:4-amino-4-deoxy-L-arabinose transferase-like glycosyltransferase
VSGEDLFLGFVRLLERQVNWVRMVQFAAADARWLLSVRIAKAGYLNPLSNRWTGFLVQCHKAKKVMPAVLANKVPRSSRLLHEQQSFWLTTSSNQLIILAVFAAMLLRTALLVWEYRHGVVIDSEGVEYVRLAQNLRSGRGYVGIFNNGLELNFPPLLPFLIAAVSFVLPSAELAARVVNVLLGSVLVVPMFKLAERIYSRQVAAIVGLMVVVHPLLVARSVMCSSEASYLSIIMFGVYWVARWLEEKTVQTGILSGLFFGLAYLIRPEALLFVAMFSAGALVAELFVHNRRPLLIGVLALSGAFAIMASPYVAFLSVNSGKFRVEGKGSFVYALGVKMRAGMGHVEAETKIRNDLSGEGVFMKSYYEVLNQTSYTSRDLILYAWHSAPKNLKTMYETLATSQTLGSPPLFILCIIGLLRTAWDRRRLVYEAILVLTAFCIVLSLLSVQEFWPRFFHSLIGLLLLWAGKGAEELYHWSRDTFALISLKPNLPRLVGVAVQCAALILAFALSLRAVVMEGEFREAMLTDRKTAGGWLAQHCPAPECRIMDISAVPAYYAGATLMYLPFASSDLALQYIAKKKPDFIVVLEGPKRSLPYLTQWFDQGIPDQRAELIYDQADRGERVKIYRWATESARNQLQTAP